MPDRDKNRQKFDDNARFRHLIGLFKQECNDYPEFEREWRAMLIQRNPKHAQEVLEEMKDVGLES